MSGGAPSPARLALIGSHAASAMSPVLWGTVLAALGSAWTYEAWEVTADELDAVRRRLTSPDIVACNVTMPHKGWAASTADVRAPSVARTASANLLIRQGSRLHAHNTDVDAFRAALAGAGGGTAVILGAGGAGRAALIAAAERFDDVLVADRDEVTAAESAGFAAAQGFRVRAIAWKGRERALADARLVVNATPIGMRRTDESAWGTVPSSSGIYYDLVYAAHQTASVRAARQAGATVVDGWRHLLLQAQEMVPLLGLSERAHELLRVTLASLRSGRPTERDE